MSDTPRGSTTPKQFRLGADTLADLDWLAAYLLSETGRESSRADAIRFAARQTRAALAKKLQKKCSGHLTL